MNDHELDRLLKSAREPERPAGYWEQFPRGVRVQLPRGRQDRSVPSRRGVFLAWSFAAAALFLIIGFAVGNWRGRADAMASNGLLQNTKAVQELLAMFPNQVRAIVQDTNGLNLVLSDTANVPDSPPLYVRICDGGQCATLVTFSGQDIQVAGQRVTVLSDAKGGVILVGDHFLWSKEEPQRLAGALRIEARELPSAGAG